MATAKEAKKCLEPPEDGRSKEWMDGLALELLKSAYYPADTLVSDLASWTVRQQISVVSSHQSLWKFILATIGTLIQYHSEFCCFKYVHWRTRMYLLSCLTSHILCFIYCFLKVWHNWWQNEQLWWERREQMATSSSAPNNSIAEGKSCNIFRFVFSFAKWLECFQWSLSSSQL